MAASAPSFGGAAATSFGGATAPSFGGAAASSFRGAAAPIFRGAAASSVGDAAAPSFGGAAASSFGGAVPTAETTILGSFERNVPPLDDLDIAFHDAGDESESLMPLSPSSSSLPSLSLMKESAKASAAQVSTTC